MHISWLGNTAIRLQIKSDAAEDISVVIDPYKQQKGAMPRSLTPHIALYTRTQEDSLTLSGDPFVLSTAGECETKSILIQALYSEVNSLLCFRLDAEKMSLGHLGRARELPQERELSMLSGIDILFIPVGGGDVYDAATAVKVVNMIEPRVVIPMAFQSENEPNMSAVSEFIREMGAKVDNPEKKVIIKDKDLPQEEVMVIVLDKE